MSRTIISALAALAALLALAAAPALAEPGKIYAFLGPSGQGKSTTISVSTSYVVIDPGEGDLVVADRTARKLYVTGPDGRLMDMSAMIPPATAATAPGTASPGGAPGDELDRYLAGIPDAVRGQIKAQIAQLPRDQQLQILNVFRGQMGLAAVTPGAAAAPAAPAAKPVGPTGNTGTIGRYPVREIAAGDDVIWVTDIGNVEHGIDFVDGMKDFGVLFRELTAGFPVPDSSMFRIGELGGFPIRVETGDGEVFGYQGARDGEVGLPR